jgi:hypothetical protein
MFQVGYAAEHDFRVTTSQFSDEMKSFLDEASEEFAAVGMYPVCDIEDVTMRPRVGCVAPMRCFAKADEDVGGCAFYLPAVGRLIFEVGCDLSDGRTLTTTTSEETASLENPPYCVRQTLPWDATVDDLLAAHRKLLSGILAADSGLVASVPKATEGILETLRKNQLRRHEFRRALGWVTLRELEALSEGRDGNALAVHREILRILGTSPSASG